MKQYPEIDRLIRPDVAIYAFDKLDGSCTRAEASRKTGFYKFGRRHGLLDDSNPTLKKEVEPAIRAKYEDALMRILYAQRWESAVFYFEFYGPKSFAGNHEEEPHTVTLFDVDVYKKGMMEPRDFIRTFESVETPRVLYTGNCNVPFVDSVKDGTLEGMTFEGVVCKGGRDRKNRDILFKVKNRAWIDRLRSYCDGNDSLFRKLL